MSKNYRGMIVIPTDDPDIKEYVDDFEEKNGKFEKIKVGNFILGKPKMRKKDNPRSGKSKDRYFSTK